MSQNTERAFSADKRVIMSWLSERGYADHAPIAVEVAKDMLRDQARTQAWKTVARRYWALNRMQREVGSTEFRDELGFRAWFSRLKSAAYMPALGKDALTPDKLRRVLDAIGILGLKAKRDRAVLLLSFAGALRRSEIASLDVEDLHFSKSGLLVHIRRSKTDQVGAGCEIAIPYVSDRGLCAVTATQEWLRVSGIMGGAAFRSFSFRRGLTDHRIDGQDIANLVKAYTSKAGLDGDFSSHSLRAGFMEYARNEYEPLTQTIRSRTLERYLGEIA